MKLLTVITLTIFTGLANADSAMKSSAMNWQCAGFDLIAEGVMENATPLTFNLVLSEHDGQDFQWKAMEDVVYSGGETANEIELMKDTVICGKDDEGNDRIGSHIWSLDINKGKFLLVSGCENEQTFIEAICK